MFCTDLTRIIKFLMYKETKFPFFGYSYMKIVRYKILTIHFIVCSTFIYFMFEVYYELSIMYVKKLISFESLKGSKKKTRGAVSMCQIDHNK